MNHMPSSGNRFFTDKQEKILLSISEVAESLGLSKPTVYTFIHRADFPSVHIGRRVMINAKLLQEWVDKQTILGKNPILD